MYSFAMMRYRPKSLCKVVLCLATVSLALLFGISVYVGTPTSTLEFNVTSNGTQTDGVAYRVKKQAIVAACSEGMFISPNGCLPCPNGTFSFPEWTECKPLLNCSEIASHVHGKQRILGGFTKQIWLAEWKGHEVVYLTCLRPSARKRCLRGMTLMEKLQSPFVTRLIGKCYERFEVSYNSNNLTLIPVMAKNFQR